MALMLFRSQYLKRAIMSLKLLIATFKLDITSLKKIDCDHARGRSRILINVGCWI